MSFSLPYETCLSDSALMFSSKIHMFLDRLIVTFAIYSSFLLGPNIRTESNLNKQIFQQRLVDLDVSRVKACLVLKIATLILLVVNVCKICLFNLLNKVQVKSTKNKIMSGQSVEKCCRPVGVLIRPQNQPFWRLFFVGVKPSLL